MLRAQEIIAGDSWHLQIITIHPMGVNPTNRGPIIVEIRYPNFRKVPYQDLKILMSRFRTHGGKPYTDRCPFKKGADPSFEGSSYEIGSFYHELRVQSSGFQRSMSDTGVLNESSRNL